MQLFGYVRYGVRGDISVKKSGKLYAMLQYPDITDGFFGAAYDGVKEPDTGPASFPADPVLFLNFC